MDLESRIDEYLESLHCELWPGESFYISQPSNRAEAILWLADIIRTIEH